jgi:plasmid replication initiation protein
MTIAEFKRKQREELEKQKSKKILKISNDFIDNTVHNNNLVAIKTIFYLSSVLEKSSLKKGVNTFNININSMLKQIDTTLPNLKKNLKAMQETSISFIDEKKKTEEYINLLPRAKIINGKGLLEIDLYDKIADLIIDVKKNFTPINIEDLVKFKNKHSLRMLPLLFRINTYSDKVGKKKSWRLDEINEFFGTKYKNFHDIERRILKPIKDDIDASSNLTFFYDITFDVIGKGRPKAVSVEIYLKELDSNNKYLGTKIEVHVSDIGDNITVSDFEIIEVFMISGDRHIKLENNDNFFIINLHGNSVETFVNEHSSKPFDLFIDNLYNKYEVKRVY